eukprot:15447881-Alexandrium_andersonii.AAC.1
MDSPKRGSCRPPSRPLSVDLAGHRSTDLARAPCAADLARGRTAWILPHLRRGLAGAPPQRGSGRGPRRIATRTCADCGSDPPASKQSK